MMCSFHRLSTMLRDKSISFHELYRFIIKTKPEKECWIWTGAKSSGGRTTKNSTYGSFGFRGPVVRPHTLAYAIWVCVELPQGYQVDHICGNTLCVNPNHLRSLPRSENARLGSLKRHGK